jgi:hypothetical protein
MPDSVECAWLIDDGAGDPQAVFWTEDPDAAEVARGSGAKVVEFVQLDSALRALVDEARRVCEREGIEDVAGWVGRTVLARVEGFAYGS